MLRLACAVLLLAAMASAAAQEKKFPARPIDMIVNFGPGGGADGLGRTVAKLVEPILGVPVPVANVAGASGNAGLAHLLQAFDFLDADIEQAHGRALDVEQHARHGAPHGREQRQRAYQTQHGSSFFLARPAPLRPHCYFIP